MKLRAVHLLRRLETIDRDLLELDTLQDRIRDDRIYADRLRSSLVEEALRLRNLKARILSQVIRNPPALLQNLADPVHSVIGPERAGTDARGPEIILPGRSPGAGPERAPTAVQSGAPAAAKKGTRAARDTARPPKPDSEDPESFEFRYE